jgi:hypothetical protein
VSGLKILVPDAEKKTSENDEDRGDETMSDAILAVAAYVCLALGVALLVVRLAGERIMRAAGVWRFRHTLRKVDGVPVEWTRAMDAMEDLHDEPAPRDRQPNRRHQHPSADDR